MNYKIEVANLSDAVELAALVNSAYRGDSSRKGWTTEADLLDGTRTDADVLKAIINTRGAVILKCQDEKGRIIGCVELKNNGDSLYLGMLTVNPELQGAGIGKILLAAAEQEARHQQVNKIVMTVISVRKELIAWYVRHGYSATGERKPFHFTDPRFGQPKQELEFVVLQKLLN